MADKQVAFDAVAELLSEVNQAPSNLSVPPSMAPFLDEIGRIFDLFENGKPITIEEILSKLEGCSQCSDKTLSDWATNCRQRILTMSPTSLKVTLRQLQEGSKLSFADNFAMEYRLSQRLVYSHDFAEGVRAVLIDKDNQPKWQPNDLSLIDSNMVQSYFEPLGLGKEWTPH